MADAPERSTVLVDVNKQIVTASSAILTLASGYATAVIGTNLDFWWQGATLGAAGILLVASICLALASNAQVTGYLKAIAVQNGNAGDIASSWNSSAFFANTAYACFALAFLSLIAFVGFRITETTVNAETVIAGAAETLVKDSRIAGRDDFVSLTATAEGYDVVFTGKDGATILCRADGETGKVTGCD